MLGSWLHSMDCSVVRDLSERGQVDSVPRLFRRKTLKLKTHQTCVCVNVCVMCQYRCIFKLPTKPDREVFGGRPVWKLCIRNPKLYKSYSHLKILFGIQTFCKFLEFVSTCHYNCKCEYIFSNFLYINISYLLYNYVQLMYI